VVVGNIVFVSGCTSVESDPASAHVTAQVELALETARRSLEAAGSRMDNVVKTLFLLTALEDYGVVRATETEFYERYAPQLVATPPAATLMVAPSLGRPELLVQYEVVAARDRDMPGWPVAYHPEHWAGKELAYPHVPKEHAKFARSQSIGNLLVISGCQALDHATVRVETGDVAEQSRIVLGKILAAVEETGGTLANLVKTNVFVKDPRAARIYREVEHAFLRERAPDVAAEPPASTVFVMTELPRPEFLIEVEAFAVLEAGAPGWGVRRLPGTAAAAESVSAGALVFLSACTSAVGDSIEREIAGALDELGEALGRAGSEVESIVKTTLFLRDARDYETLQEQLRTFYETHAPRLLETPPASTFTEVAEIVPSRARFQIDAIAVA
jgi:2-iminobutanoate/2-iminopropanoate deaminase